MGPGASVRQGPPLSAERWRSTVMTPAPLLHRIVGCSPPNHTPPPVSVASTSACESAAGQPASCRVTEPETRFNARRSGVPSSLKSFTATKLGLLPPVGYVIGASNAPVPSPGTIAVVLPLLFKATARSGRPSWSQSPTVTALGAWLVTTVVEATNVPSGTPSLPPPISTLSELAPLLHTATSAMPSPFQSPVAMSLGWAPTNVIGATENVP